VACDSHVLFLRDIVMLGDGWRQRRMVASSVGARRGGDDVIDDLGM
jgi:hypothetical protein